MIQTAFNFAFKFNLRRYSEVREHAEALEKYREMNKVGRCRLTLSKPKLKPPGTKRLKVNCDVLLSTSAFKFNLRRYKEEMLEADQEALRREREGVRATLGRAVQIQIHVCKHGIKGHCRV